MAIKRALDGWSRRPPWSFSCHCWWRSRSLCGSIRADPRCSPSCVPVATVPFRILKFRTMCEDAEERISEVIAVDELSEPMFKIREDPRVTRVGRLLRRTSLDELPQLFNVLRGDMSRGSSSEEVWLVERYGETQRFRLQMRPGLTGPMQVHGRGRLNFQERMAVEREYVENYSLRKDIKILFRTGSAIFGACGAY